MKTPPAQSPSLASARARSPVLDGKDLVAQDTSPAIHLVSDIYRQNTVEGLARVSEQVILLEHKLAAADASADSTGQRVTAIADALTTRLIQLAETRFGSAPIDYVWVAAGSQARSYALAGGVSAANSHDRLALAAQTNEVSVQGALDLRDAFEFMGKLRIAHQMRQTSQGLIANNFMTLAELSSFARNQLKQAFSVVQTLQNSLALRYQSEQFQ